MTDIRELDLVRMATYIFVEACNNSQSGNWKVDIDDVEHTFGVEITKDAYYEISDLLYEHFELQVLDVNENDYDYYYEQGYWDITIGGYYTMYGDDDYDDEPVEQQKITTADVKTKDELLDDLKKLQKDMEKEITSGELQEEDVCYNKGYIQAIGYISQQIKKLEVK